MEEKSGGDNTKEAVGVRFKRNGKIYYFDPSDIGLKIGDNVIVETARGLEMGEVVITDAEKINNRIKSLVLLFLIGRSFIAKKSKRLFSKFQSISPARSGSLENGAIKRAKVGLYL